MTFFYGSIKAQKQGEIIQFNSVCFVSPIITDHTFASEGFTICTHRTSLTFDLTSDQEKLPRNRKKNVHGEK